MACDQVKFGFNVLQVHTKTLARSNDCQCFLLGLGRGGSRGRVQWPSEMTCGFQMQIVCGVYGFDVKHKTRLMKIC